MYAYSGDRGPVLNTIAKLDFKHRRPIAKKLLMLSSLTVVEAQGLNWFGGPYLQAEDISIYGVKVHAPNTTQYRLPFAPFLDGHIILGIESRKDLDFGSLALEALSRYREVISNQSTYVKFQPGTSEFVLSYR